MKKHTSLTMVLALLCAFSTALVAQDCVKSTSKTRTFQNGLGDYSGALEVGIEKGKGKLDTKSNNVWIERNFKRGELLVERQTLARFDDIFGGKDTQIPPGASITKATLRLHVGGLKSATSFHRIFLNRMLVSWDKNAAWKYKSWGNNGIQADGKEAVVERDAHFVPNLNDQAYDIDVTESLRAWARGEPNHGWVFRDVRDHPVAAAFISSRVARPELRPMLIVSYDAKPANNAPKAEKLSAAPSGKNITLSLDATDAEKDPLTVTLYGRKRAKAGPDFQAILLPDTQYYTPLKKYGGSPEMLYSQIDWIIKNRVERNIAFVLQLGDLTDVGDAHKDLEWEAISNGFYRLEDPKTTGLPDGIPYVVSVGNHDQRYKGDDGKTKMDGITEYYNKYFGVNHFKGKNYYGGSSDGKMNNNYYILADGGDEKFIIISLEYDFANRNGRVIKWADKLLSQHADRRGIVVTHATIMPGVPGAFQEHGGLEAYEGLKHNKNLMLIIGGHTTGEGHRTDVFEGSVIHSIVQDFQLDGDGGNGWLGILTFSPRQNQISIETHSPYIDQWRQDTAGKYTLDYDFGTKIDSFEKLSTQQVAANSTVSHTWENLEADNDYEWYVEISDGQKTIRTQTSVVRLK